MSITEETDVVRQVPTIRCILSISFADEVTARNFVIEIDALLGGHAGIFKPRVSDEWIVEAVVIEEVCWHIDEAVSKLFDSIVNIKDQINELIVQYCGKVVIDIAVYEMETHPALFFSRETIRNICFFSASVGIDLV